VAPIIEETLPSFGPERVAAAEFSHRDRSNTLASHILLYSFVAAVVLAIGGFVVVSTYLFLYLNHAFNAFDTSSMTQFAGMEPDRLQPILLARAGLWKFILQSCGIIAGVAFGFLGFALFLLGAKGDIDASVSNSLHKVQLSRMAPGSLVILIAAVLIGVCSVSKVELSLDPIVTTTTTTSSAPTPAKAPPAIPTSDPIKNPSDLPIYPATHAQPGKAGK
jgi:hypothetical protein